jgi:hypothetical protein
MPAPLMDPVTFLNTLEESLKQAIQERVNEARERIVQVAVETFEKEVRQLIGSVAVNLSQFYSIQRLGPDLVIHVKMDKQV